MPPLARPCARAKCGITKLLIVVGLALLLPACGSLQYAPYLIAAGPRGNDHCRDDHPVFAHIRHCPPPRHVEPGVPYDPVTRRNANDRDHGACLLELAASYGNFAVFDSLVEKGAKPELCTPGYEDRIFRSLVRGACGRTIPLGEMDAALQRLDQLSIRPTKIQSVLTDGCDSLCGPAVRYALARGADPTSVRICRAGVIAR